MSARVDVDIVGHVATLTLNDLDRKNAMTVALGDAVKAAVDVVNADDAVRAVVVTGAGGDFSAGGDLAMLNRLRTVSHDEAREHMLAFYGRYLSLLDVRVPTIAAVRGAAIGAGLCVACACDIVVVGEDAKLAFNFVSLGLHPGMGGTFLVPHKVGAQRAADLLYTGRRFDGKEAKAIGLALDAVPDDKVVEVARSYAEKMTKNAPGSVRDLKSSLRVDVSALSAALHREAEAQARSYASPELGEGLAAITGKRAPKF